MTKDASSPLCLDRPDLIHQVREILDRTGFDESHVPKRLGSKEMTAPGFGPLDRTRIQWRTRDSDPLGMLIRLFLAGVPVPLDAFGRAAQPMDPADWAGLGLVDIHGQTVQRAVVLKPCEGLIIAYDCTLPDGSQRYDHVLGLTGSTVTFSKAMIRPRVASTLDLGTGSGFLALLAARHSQRVLASDLNPRAVGMTRFNALLNGVENVEAVEGDLFEPAHDDRFDLIACNPPFVVSPENDVMFRDSGLGGDAICERIVRATPAHLAEGGFAQVMCNWVRPAGHDWRERLRSWVGDSGCDAWIIHIHTDEPDFYADHWLRQGDQRDLDRLGARFERWMSYYQEQGIDAIDSGLIMLRRRSGGRNWVAFDTERRLNVPNGVALLAAFEARDLLQGLGDDRALLDLRLRCRSELRLVQRLEPAQSGWLVAGAECVLGEGLRFEGQMNPLIFHLLTLCRGDQPLSAVLAQVAARLGQDAASILPAALESVRDLVSQGFLWPADGPPGAFERGQRIGSA
jgi:predicted RNA methylase